MRYAATAVGDVGKIRPGSSTAATARTPEVLRVGEGQWRVVAVDERLGIVPVDRQQP
ncbi:hypothetical protein ACWD25_52795 [Streptomyces sp. NPDC002920]